VENLQNLQLFKFSSSAQRDFSAAKLSSAKIFELAELGTLSKSLS
jgi:hypothetical protein